LTLATEPVASAISSAGAGGVIGVDWVGGVSGLGCEGAGSCPAAIAAPAENISADNPHIAAGDLLVLMMRLLCSGTKAANLVDLRPSRDAGAVCAPDAIRNGSRRQDALPGANTAVAGERLRPATYSVLAERRLKQAARIFAAR
jgi:hypothetical protein